MLSSDEEELDAFADFMEAQHVGRKDVGRLQVDDLLEELDEDKAKAMDPLQRELLLELIECSSIDDEEVDGHDANAESEDIEDLSPRRKCRKHCHENPEPGLGGDNLESAAQSRGMSPRSFGRLLTFGVPMILLNILFWMDLKHPIEDPTSMLPFPF